MIFFFFFKQKTAYEMRISDWSSDVCSSDRHAGRRSATLHVDDDRRDLGEIGEADEFGHQADAGTGGRGEDTGAVPTRADHDADRGQLVLGLEDRKSVV